MSYNSLAEFTLKYMLLGLGLGCVAQLLGYYVSLYRR